MTPPLKPVPQLETHERGTAAGMAKVLASQVGYREGVDNDNAFGVWYGNNHVSWCAQFQSWGAATAGVTLDVILKHQYTPTGKDWFQGREEVFRDVGFPGDLIYVYYDKLGRIGHVAFVEYVETAGDGTRIYHTLEGNTNDTGSDQGVGVFRLERTQTGRLYFARPSYKDPQEDDMSTEDVARLEKKIDDLASVFARTVAPGQTTFEGTIEATLGTVQEAINEIRASERMLVLGVTDKPERYLVTPKGIAHIPTDVFRADLADSDVITIRFVDQPTLDWLLDVAGAAA